VWVGEDFNRLTFFYNLLGWTRLSTRPTCDPAIEPGRPPGRVLKQCLLHGVENPWSLGRTKRPLPMSQMPIHCKPFLLYQYLVSGKVMQAWFWFLSELEKLSVSYRLQSTIWDIQTNFTFCIFWWFGNLRN